jgi:flagellar biosynthesis GTPase FlhF
LFGEIGVDNLYKYILYKMSATRNVKSFPIIIFTTDTKILSLEEMLYPKHTPELDYFEKFLKKYENEIKTKCRELFISRISVYELTDNKDHDEYYTFNDIFNEKTIVNRKEVHSFCFISPSNDNRTMNKFIDFLRRLSSKGNFKFNFSSGMFEGDSSKPKGLSRKSHFSFIVDENVSAEEVKKLKEKAERESKEKAEKKAREKAEKEAREKAEKEAREKAEKEAREKAEKEAREKAEKEARKRLKKKLERRLKKKRERRLKKKLERRLKKKLEKAKDLH